MVTGSFSLVGIEDGIGNETIFTITSTSNKPGRPSSVNTDGYVPDGWYANPQDVSATYQYQWVCKREKKEGNWGAWSEPSLYSNFADGIKYVLNYYGLSSSATTEPTSWSLTPPTMSSTMRYLWNYEIIGLNSGETYETDRTVIGVYGDDGEPGTPGTDGVGIDYIREYYLATSQSSGVTTSTSGWTMSIQTITSTKKYLWNYEVIMYTNGYRDVGDPKIIGVYGDKGDQGESGTDGKGYEYCYRATQYNVTPSTPTSSNVDGSIPSGWYSTPPSISATNAYIWESQRTKIKGTWSSWSTPKLKNRWAYDGIDGANGDKGAKMRMRTWKSGVRYLQGAEGEEFYDIVVYETKLYLCTKTHTSSSSNNPIKSIEGYLGYWESAQQWTFVATQLLLAGKIVSDKITADLIDADGLTAKDITVYGSIRTGFTEGDSFGLEYSDNIVVPNPGSPGGFWEPYVTMVTLPLAVASNIGRRITITVTQGEGMASVQFASGYEADIWENGEIVNTLTILGGETVELLAYGVNKVFKAWIVLKRTRPNVISAPTIKSGATYVGQQSINSSQSIKDDVTFVIIASTNAITVNLPSNSPSGRVLYIRSLNWGKVTFSGRIRFTDGTYVTDNWSIEDSHPRMFIYDGSYWNEFFCSVIK